MNNNDQPSERAITAFIAVLSLLSYARLYMLRDGYADDNAWLLAMYISDSASDFLASFLELRRVPQGVFFYFLLLPYRYLENPFLIWHTLILAVQVATPIVLYKFARSYSNDAWLALFVAGVFLVLPLEHVAPYLCTVNYRLGGLLGLASLYLTDVAAREGRWGWRVPAAIVLAAVAGHVLTEGAIALEPARALLLWLRFHREGQPLREVIVRVAKWLAPFALLAFALVVYKLTFKPYGIYAGMYSTRFAHLLDSEAIDGAIRLFALGVWRYLRPLYPHAQPGTLALAALGALLVFFFLRRSLKARPAAGAGSRILVRSHWLAVALGTAILVPGLFLFFYAARPPRLGSDSTHATLIQPGYALIIGAIVHHLVLRARAAGGRYLAAATLGCALIAGAGIFFTNLNLDLFKVASTRQEEFWRAFKKRFPVLPQQTDFVVDAAPPKYHRRLETFFHFEDLHASYELEHSLNRLYAPGRLTGKRIHRVYALEEMMHDYRTKGPSLFARKLERWSHFGTDTLDFAAMTYVYWRGGEVYVNHEILSQDAAALYGDLANKPLPPWTAPLTGG